MILLQTNFSAVFGEFKDSSMSRVRLHRLHPLLGHRSFCNSYPLFGNHVEMADRGMARYHQFNFNDGITPNRFVDHTNVTFAREKYMFPSHVYVFLCADLWLRITEEKRKFLAGTKLLHFKDWNRREHSVQYL